MPALATLYEPIAADMEKVCRVFDDELFSELPVVNELCARVRHYRGKMLRPALVLLSGKACGQINGEHITLAAVVEMVHMATLVHDDVLDEADLRRQSPTVNRVEGNEAAILLGDYLISHAFHLCSSLDSQYASRLIGATTNTVCEGELQQVHHRGDDELTLEQYLQIITRKTAALTGACCRLGAYYAGAAPAVVDALETYGLEVGVAFQITDDVLDITGSEARMGKTLGRDLDKHKLTLPVIHCLQTADRGTARRVREHLAANRPDRRQLREWLESTGSIRYALVSARRYVDAAVARLDDLPPTDARDTLIRMARMIIEREQ
jgi:octaprenyl-diphosphate synthase